MSSKQSTERFLTLPLALSYDDVLLVPKYSQVNSRSDIDLTTKLAPKLTLKIPLIPTKMDTITGVEMAIKMGEIGGMAILPRFDKPEIQADNVAKVKKAGITNIAVAIGCTNGYMERAEMLVKAGATVLHNDVAHGHLKKNIESIKAFKNKFGDEITLMPGIAATYACAVDMYKAGADIVSSGVGAGSICITRTQTGCGLPGFQSLIEISRAAKQFNKTFIPEAGIRNSGDIVKALAIGASAIVGGSIFAGTDETPGEIIEVDGKLYKKYNGAASEEEKIKQVDKDNTGKHKMYIKHVEGVSAMKPYKGSLEETITSLLAGVRSGMSYCGAHTIPELWEKAEFVRVTQAGVLENSHHGVILRN